MKLKHWIWALALSTLYFGSLMWAARVRLVDGTPVRVRLKAELSSTRVHPGDRVDFEVARPTIVRGLVVIPEGSIAWGAVQSVKRGKEVQFDIEGLRLPNLVEIKLRSIREKVKRSSKHRSGGLGEYGGGVGLSRGSEFTAYVDEDVEVEGVATQPAVPSAPRIAPVAAPAPTPQAVGPPPAHVAAPAPPALVDTIGADERVTVECFSEPSGADILIDGEFYGSTPSILKVRAGNHRLEITLAGYKTFTQALDLTAGGAFRTIRASLEKKD